MKNISTSARPTSTKPTVVLLDSHAMLHRSYHAFPHLTSPSGEPSGALFGMCQMLIHVMSEFHPHDVIACFDLPEDTFRHTAYDGYKAGRTQTDDALSLQIERAHSLVQTWGIPVVESPGFEADDCLGTLARQYHELGYRVVIASGDRDTLQLVVGDEVVVWTLKKNIKESIVFSEDAVYEYYGFGPKLIPDYKALAGDSSDNIPGIRGIGDKTARALVSTLGSLEDIYHAIENRPDDVRAVVSNRMYDLLVNGREDADFSRILGEIRCDAPVVPILHESDWVARASLDSILSVCRAYSFTSLMSKVSALFPAGSSNNQLSLFGGDELPAISDSELRPLQIARWVLDSTKTGETWESLCRWAQASTVAGVWDVINRELELAHSTFVWESIERPLMPIVAQMRERGMLLDIGMLENIGARITEALTIISAQIFDMAGGEFNINSPKQMAEVLFERMAIPTKGLRKNKSGGYSTQESELEKLRANNPIIDKILEYRGLTKLQSTYIESLPKYCDHESRIHPWLRQDGAATGRFSCTDPNIQNIPIRTELGKSLRNAFRAPEGYQIVKFDYSQIELRLAALLADEVAMCELFQSGVDIHSAVASSVFGVEIVDITREQRRRAKVINFGILYGMGASALAVELGTIRTEAEEYLATYFARFPRLRAYAEENIAHAAEHGYTVTLFGRRRNIPEFGSSNGALRAYAERIAMNAPIQGTAADVMKLGMLLADTVCQKYSVYMIAQVHDELLFEVPIHHVEHFAADMKIALESVLEVYAPEKSRMVPLVVESEQGRSWGETTRILL